MCILKWINQNAALRAGILSWLTTFKHCWSERGDIYTGLAANINQCTLWYAMKYNITKVRFQNALGLSKSGCPPLG